MKDEIVDVIANELLGVIPIHKGPFVSNAEALRCAHYDNDKRYEIAKRIADAVKAHTQHSAQERYERGVEFASKAGAFASRKDLLTYIDKTIRITAGLNE